MNSIKHMIVLLLTAMLVMTQLPVDTFAEEVSEETDAGGRNAVTAEEIIEGEQEKTEEPAKDEGSPSSEEDGGREGAVSLGELDCLAYDPLYIEKYADDSYVSTDDTSMGSYVNIVTAAKGIATYNIAGQKDFEVSEGNYIAGMNYEIPVYDVDRESGYYVAIPDVAPFDKGFRDYDLMVAYNNDYGENIKGWKYKNGILYIPKSAIDKPKNHEDIPDTAMIAVQINYAIGDDMDFSKSIPVQIISDGEPVCKKVKAANIFDLDCMSLDTGIKGRNAEDISVFLNGMMIPINHDAFTYHKESGYLDIQAMPGVISNINIVFRKQSFAAKAVSKASAAISAVTCSAYAASLKSMENLKTESGKDVVLEFDTSKMFTGWRGHYKSRILHGNSYITSHHKELDGFDNSIKYLYGGYTSMSGADMESSSNKEIDAGLVPLWAIQSYAVGGDVSLATNTDDIEYDTLVKHYVTAGKTEKHTMYEWLMEYRNDLEKTNDTIIGNGIGGSNNFAAHWPICTVKGSSKCLTPDKRENPDITFESDQISSSEWYAASCSELDDTASSESDSDVYVTCLAITDEYVVLAMVQARGGQNMCAIYKFKVKPKAYVYVQKKNGGTACDYNKDLPNNYSLKGAVYRIYNDSACTDRAKDADGHDVELVTDEEGKTAAAAMDPGTYYIKEVTASTGFMYDRPSDGIYKGISITAENTEKDPAVFLSKEPPSVGAPELRVYKMDPTGRYSWNKLIGAEYRISYYDVTSKEDIGSAAPVRSWLFRTRKIEGNGVKGTYYAGFDWLTDEALSGSDEFYVENGIRVIPCGWFTIQEINAPSGLALNDALTYGRVYQTSNGTEAVTEVEDAESSGEKGINVAVDDSPQQVKIVINKTDATTGKNTARESGADHSDTRLGRFASLAGAEYEVYYDDPDLSGPELVGVIVTDEKGYGELTVRESGDERAIGGSLSTGGYLIKEVKPAPGFVIDSYAYSKNKQIEVNDRAETIVCTYESSAETVIKEIKGQFSGGSHIFSTRSESTNTISFTYTTASADEGTRTYINKIDADSGKPVEGAQLQVISMNEEDEGQIVEEWVSSSEKHLIWELPAGKYILRESSAPAGYLPAEDVEFTVEENVIVTNVEMADKPVKISTTALDKSDRDHYLKAGKSAHVVDSVKYSGLSAGSEYYIYGTIYDKTSGKLTDICGETEFTACGSEGSVKVGFEFDASGLEGHSLVVFEYLFSDGELISRHDDISSKAQTVFIKKAKSPRTGDSPAVIIFSAVFVSAVTMLIIAIHLRKRAR